MPVRTRLPLRTARFLLPLLAALALLAGCAPRAGDACTPGSNSCGSSFTCYGCNIPDGSSAVCEKPCTTDNDCVGTSNPIGPTPACGVDTCGNHFCTLRF